MQALNPVYKPTGRLLRNRAETGEGLGEFGFEVGDVFEANVEAQRRAGGGPAGRGAVGRGIEGDDEAFKAAPGIAHAEKFQSVEHGGELGAADGLEDNGEQARAAEEIALEWAGLEDDFDLENVDGGLNSVGAELEEG